MRNFIDNQKGSVPFTALGIVMLLIAAVGVHHFSDLDELKVEQRASRRADMQTFYGLANFAFDIQQKARGTAETTLIKNSAGSYAEPIDVDSWHEDEGYIAWREALAEEISSNTKRELVDFFNKHIPNESHDTGLEYDLTNFVGGKGDDPISVGVVHDNVQGNLLLNISIEPSRNIRIRNRDTGFSFAMRDDTLVEVDARPFAMADAVYDFTGIFKRESENPWDFNASRDTVDEFAWYIWAVEEVLGLLEANLKHDVRFATDERATYSLANVIIAFKEKEHFGTFDYLHVVREVLRPWAGDERSGREFLSLLKRGLESGYIDQATSMMESGVLLSRLNLLTSKANDNFMRVVARLDSSLINAANFPKDFIPEGLPNRGAIQQLRTARDISALSTAEGDLWDVRTSVAASTRDPESFQDEWTKTVRRHRGEVQREYREFKDEVVNAEASLGSAIAEMGIVATSIEKMGHALNESKCESMISSQLWYGSDGSQGLEGILPLKMEEAVNISDRLTNLNDIMGKMRYYDADGTIDETYEFASSDMRKAESSLESASTYRGYFLSCRDTWSRSHSRPTAGCEESREMEEEYDCGSEEEPATCTRRWKEYRCTCKESYRLEYSDRMSRASYTLSSAAGNIRTLNSSITNWFHEHGYENALAEISDIHGYETGGGLMDFYYNHYDANLPDSRGYVKAFEHILNLTEPRDKSSPRPGLSYNVGHASENFVDYGYGFIHATLTGLYIAFNPTGASIEYDKARDALEAMQDNGFFEFVLEVITAISDLFDSFGNILNMLSTIDRDYASFPTLSDHLYAAFPLPPIAGSTKGFSVLHDIRLRADNHPAVLEFSLPLIGKRRFELPPGASQKGGKGYSIPIPFTPMNMYAWEFDVARSQRGSEPFSEEAIGEKSTLWVIDYENQGNLAPLGMMMLGNETLPTPVYLHRPLMYKYEFTAGDYTETTGSIAKGFKRGKLPPVILISLGPFATNFRGWIEPPDAGGDNVPVDITIEDAKDRIEIVAKLLQDAEKPKGEFLLRIYESGGADSSNSLLSRELKGSLDEMPSELVVNKMDLSLLKSYGWSLVNADLYGLDGKGSSGNEVFDHVVGEDHSSITIIDPALSVDVRFTDYDGESVGIVNKGNRLVDVVLATLDGCCFFKEGSSWERGLWSGSLVAGEEKRVKIKPSGPASLELKVEVPIEVQRVLVEDSGARLYDKYEFNLLY